MIPKPVYDAICIAYKNGKTIKILAQDFGYTDSTIRKQLVENGVKIRNSEEAYNVLNPPPTAEEIEQRAQEIQEGWDDKTRESRAVIKRKPYEVPHVKGRSSRKAIISGN